MWDITRRFEIKSKQKLHDCLSFFRGISLGLTPNRVKTSVLDHLAKC